MDNKATILVVDDEPSVRRALHRLFTREQYRVVEAGGVAEALKVLGATTIDLVITDKADLNAVIAAINDGHIYRFVLKPWDNEELCLSVRLALEQAKLLSENRKLVGRLQEQEDMLRALAKQHPGIMTVERDADGAIVLDDPDEEAA